jgi:hypothetical protein
MYIYRCKLKIVENYDLSVFIWFSFNSETIRIWWRLFLRYIVHTKFDIYVFIALKNQQFDIRLT